MFRDTEFPTLNAPTLKVRPRLHTAARAGASEARHASECTGARPTGGAASGEHWADARADLVVELVALEHVLGQLGDALAQVRAVRVDEPEQ
eukprot:15464022-Alexandrium_andersonii.AAC.1